MELAEPATMFVVPGDNCRLASFATLRSLGAGRPWAGVMTEFAGADWSVGAVCGLCLFAFLLFPPFRLGAIRNKIFVRSIASYDAGLFNPKLVSPLEFSFKYSQSHPCRSGESLQGRASFVSLAWPNTPQP